MSLSVFFTAYFPLILSASSLALAWEASAQKPGLPAKSERKSAAKPGIRETAPRLPSEALIGFAVRDMKTGRLLAQSNPNRNFIPGSAIKIITAQMALEAMNPDTVFTTRLCHSGEIRKNVLQGDLIIRGGGDPALGSREYGPAFKAAALFAAWADSLRARGIASVEGTVLPDASALEHSGPDPGVLWEDAGNYYAALATGLAFLDNAYALRFQGNPRLGEPFALLGTEPAAVGIAGFENHLRAGPSGSRDSAYILGAPPSPLRTLRGTYPAGHWEFRIRGALPNPGWTLSREWKAYLEGQGLRFKESHAPGPQEAIPPSRLPATGPHQALATWPSPPLRDLLRRMLVFSDNHVAAHLFAHAAKGMGQAGSREGGAIALRALAKKEGWSERQMVIYDGHGLSPLNRISPAQFTLWLQRAAVRQATFPVLRDAMPGGPGAEEKLARYGADLQGRLWAKTGTLEGVAALAGYLSTRSGRLVGFALFANHFSGPSGEVQAAFGALIRDWSKL